MKRKTDKEFKSEVKALVGSEYTVLGNYINAKDKVLIKHNKCNYEWRILSNNFLRGSRCPKCSGKAKKSTASFKNEIRETLNNEYTVLGEYKNNHTKILIKHNKCGCEWCIRPDAFLNGNRCPYCNESHGEVKTAEWLNDNKISFIKQYRFKDCRRNKPLPFDFYLPDKKVAIEYDGRQHYMPVGKFGGLKALKYQKQNDHIKDEYCKNNGIKLIRIKYNQDINGMLKSQIISNKSQEISNL